MRYYFEAHENVKDMETAQEFIRIDITDMTNSEKKAVLTEIKDIMAGKDYRLVYHKCGHDQGTRCQMKEVG